MITPTPEKVYIYKNITPIVENINNDDNNKYNDKD